MAVFPAGHILTSADFDTLFPTGVGAWTAYTPTWTASTTNPVLGNGTIDGAYSEVGGLIRFRAAITPGSTTTFGSGNYSISLPVAGATGQTGYPIGGASMVDASAGTRYTRHLIMWVGDNTTLALAEGGAVVTHASPAVWANGDLFYFSGTYEPAT